MTPETRTSTDSRNSPREPLDGEVRVRFLAEELSGPGQDLSQDGVFLVAEDEIHVEVTLPDGQGIRKGTLVRVNALRAGQSGLAIRFSED